jgi:hypothetical protein
MGEERYSEKTLFKCRFTINCAWTHPGENRGLCGERTPTNSLINPVMEIHLSLHTNKCTSIIYYLKSVLIKIKTLYSPINAQQARLSNIYKNTKPKLLKVNAAIWFNTICREKQLKPNYINLKINGRRQQDVRTTTHAIKFLINQEIKFLYKKKQHLKEL